MDHLLRGADAAPVWLGYYLGAAFGFALTWLVLGLDGGGRDLAALLLALALARLALWLVPMCGFRGQACRNAGSWPRRPGRPSRVAVRNPRRTLIRPPISTPTR